ncbi:autotransporter domain-containing protein [Ruegeria arenilitoris]|uniref:autotransporter domain-containing protein n=1 Tax=Ruegeria arenilitoris TaxID=1173585 RepID=UPI00147E250D
MKWKGRVASVAPSLFLASVSATALTVGNAQAQVISTPQNTQAVISSDIDATITETGAINLTTAAVAAVEINTNYSSTATNNGTITGPSSGNSFGIGVVLTGNLEASGAIRNNGTINIAANGSSGAAALGFLMLQEYSGAFANTGTVTASANSTSSNGASALGAVFVGGVESTATISNSGTIKATAAGAEGASALGLLFVSDINTGISNSGAVTVNAAADTSATAWAYHLESDLNGNFNNTGTITANASASSGSVDAAAVYIEGDTNGSISNSGTIRAIGQASSEVSASGFYLSGNLNGNFTNSGTIDIRGTSTSTDSVEAFGLYVSEDLIGNFANSGTLTVNTQTDNGSAEAFGLFIANDLEGDVTNSGSITVNARGESEASAAGLKIDDDFEGNFQNSGSITATAISDTSEAYATGLIVEDRMEGNLSNSGSITADATGYESALAAGFAVQDGIVGNVTNSGTVNVTSTTTDDESEAYGFYIRNEDPRDEDASLEGNFTNSGNITVRAEGDTGSAYASGLYVRHGFEGNLTNSGVIDTVSISKKDWATARGIYIRGDTTGSVANSGSISVLAQGAANLRAQGILLYDDVNASVTNSGTIDATAKIVNGTDGARASAAGVWIEDMQGTFSNTGTITATATGGASSEAYGLYFENFDGVISDVGRISATSDGGKAYAIFLGTGSGTLNVDSKDQVSGLIRVQDHNVNLDAQGGSNVFYFEDAAPSVGVFTTQVSDGRSAWFVQDEGGSAPVYAVVDTGDLGISGDVTAFFGSVVGGASDALRYDQPAQVSRGFAFQQATAAFGGFRPYAMIDAQYRQFETVPGNDTDIVLFDGSVGLSGQLDNGLSLAVGMGVFNADGDTDTTDFDTTGFYLDTAIGRQVGAYTLEFGFGYGWLSTDRSRQITGSPDAHADYDSQLLTAHIGIERAFHVSDDFGLLGIGEVRYTRQKDDEYTETRSDANATVGSATTEVIEARLGAEIDKELGHGGVISGQLSGVLRRGLGDTNADVTVFSSTETLTFASTDFTGASIVLGYEKDLMHGMQFEATAEQEIGNDAQGPYLRAGLNWSF